MWEQPWFKDSYLTYFLFTQSTRLYYVFNKVKFYLNQAPSNIVDFGCGPGTAQKVFEGVLEHKAPTNHWINVDKFSEALDLAKKWNRETGFKTKFLQSDVIPRAQTDNDLLIAAYSLCELYSQNQKQIDALKDYKTLIILEPGQKGESKKLIELRNELISEHGFYAYAPCPHQKTCPMTDEKKHWCHDHIEKPDCLNAYKLPFSQNKLNLSYMLLSKKHLKKRQNYGRIVGDLRPEKGKTKIATCFDGRLSYISWLKKTKLSIDINRGDLIRWMDDFEKKGHEIRISTPLQRVYEEHFADDSGPAIPDT